MLMLNLPQYPIKVAKRGEQKLIYDDLRRKYVALTPEEWVRQHFIHYLIDFKHYPAALIANETTITLANTTKRCDSIVYDRNGMPKVIIEYKASSVKLTQKVFSQIGRYNMVLKVDYLIISNGLNHYCCKMDYDKQSYVFLNNIPCYEEL